MIDNIEKLKKHAQTIRKEYEKYCEATGEGDQTDSWEAASYFVDNIYKDLNAILSAIEKCE